MYPREAGNRETDIPGGRWRMEPEPAFKVLLWKHQLDSHKIHKVISMQIAEI